MVRTERPVGTPDDETDRSRQVWALKNSPVLSHLDPEERVAITGSISHTVQRAEYHYLRLRDIRDDLDQRRANLPGEARFDSLVVALHSELQGFCGAARTCVDELVYLIARRHGAAQTEARKRPWEPYDLVTKSPLPPECAVPEVAKLRVRKLWFETLNAYRNSFFHNGWRYGAGHYSKDDTSRAAQTPAMNGLLLPDRASLTTRSKPFEWSWSDRTHIDDVSREVRTGLDDLLRELCEADWATPTLAQGKAPREEHPNIVVLLPKPAVLTTNHAWFIPLFSTRELGERCEPFCKNEALELAKLAPSSLLTGEPTFAFHLNGFEKEKVPRNITEIRCVLDPVPADPAWRVVGVTDCALLPIASVSPFWMAFPFAGYAHLFMWQEAMLIDWSTGLR